MQNLALILRDSTKKPALNHAKKERGTQDKRKKVKKIVKIVKESFCVSETNNLLDNSLAYIQVISLSE